MVRFSYIALIFLLSPAVWGQNCEPATTPDTDDERFAVNDNGTVTDLRTGLMWQRCLSGLQGSNCSSGEAGAFDRINVEVQARQANENKLLGYSDWRIPTVDELTSIVSSNCRSPAIDLTAFPGTPSTFVWSIPPNERHSHFSWHVHFNDGKPGYHYRDRRYKLRLVRTVESLAAEIAKPKKKPLFFGSKI